jgi:hypothetical protein
MAAATFFPWLTPGVWAKVLLHLPFFALGLFMAERALTLKVFVPRRAWALAILAPALGLGTAAMAASPFAAVSLPALPLSIAGISLMLALAGYLARTPIADHLARLGQVSMAVFVMHVVFTAGLRIALGKLGSIPVPVLLGLGTAAGVALPLIFYALLARLGLAKWAGLTGRTPWETSKDRAHPLLAAWARTAEMAPQGGESRQPKLSGHAG